MASIGRRARAIFSVQTRAVRLDVVCRPGGNPTLSKTLTNSRSCYTQDVLRTRKSISVLDSSISHLDTNGGDNAIIFLHGNFTSAYLWRNIIPSLSSLARCLAPDLIGMGYSGKPDIKYTFGDQYRYLSAWVEQMDLPQKITIVGHEWGSALGFNWCYHNPDRVEALIHMDSLVAPLPSWERLPDYFPEGKLDEMELLRVDQGVEMVLEANYVRHAIRRYTRTHVSDEVIDEYCAPYNNVRYRLPLLMWARELPIVRDGPDDVIDVVKNYSRWLTDSSELPKLLVATDCGVFGKFSRKNASRWPNQRIVEIHGKHLIQEDNPKEVSMIIKTFLQDIFDNRSVSHQSQG